MLLPLDKWIAIQRLGHFLTNLFCSMTG